MSKKVNIFWFRRDLSLEDNHGLYKALTSDKPIIGIFIFDKEILEELDNDDSRVSFIHNKLLEIDNKLKEYNSSLLIKHGKVMDSFTEILSNYKIDTVFTNEDYEPYAIKRDKSVEELLSSNKINFISCKNQVIFHKSDVLKKDGKPYTVFTPYKNKWLEKFESEDIQHYPSEKFLHNFDNQSFDFPGLKELGFVKGSFVVKPFTLSNIKDYEKQRDYPAIDAGSYLGPHLRFGTVSIRKLVNSANNLNKTFLSELIWREFFMQILYHFPHVEYKSFKPVYDNIKWENNEDLFAKWCNGETGYPIVDAGMKELSTTGYMHNRVRMITASFLVKHLLIDWRWGEAYFAKMLLDYELSSNNGNWQWAASTGCDAVPYFRIFNPYTQHNKFDKNNTYTSKYLHKEYNIKPIIEHKFARERAINRYKECINSDKLI